MGLGVCGRGVGGWGADGLCGGCAGWGGWVCDQNGAKREPQGDQTHPKWNRKGAKMSQGTFKRTPCGTGSKKEAKV